MTQQRDSTASSTGQVFAVVGWLDAHFEAARPEYEAMVREAGFQRGGECSTQAAAAGASCFCWLNWLDRPARWRRSIWRRRTLPHCANVSPNGSLRLRLRRKWLGVCPALS